MADLEPFVVDSEEGIEDAAEAYLRAWCQQRGEAWEGPPDYVSKFIRDQQISHLVQFARAELHRRRLSSSPPGTDERGA